jgi:hypothetical protein
LVTGVSVGSAIITATSVETPSISGTLSVTITEQVISYTLISSRTGLTSNTYAPINVSEVNGTWTGSANKTGENIGTNATNGITFTAASGFYIYSVRMVVISTSTQSRTIIGNSQTFVTLTSASPADSDVVILDGNPTTIALVASSALQYQYITVVVRPIS